MQKPSLLRTACDGASQLRLIDDQVNSISLRPTVPTRFPARRHTYRPQCKCSSLRDKREVYYRPTQNIRMRLGASSHSRNCPLFWTARDTYILDLRFVFYSMFLSKTVQAAFSLTRGAGGCSISPKLIFRATVSNDSGAFSVLQNMGPKVSPADADKVLREITTLFMQGRASPTDLDTNGQNLLHVCPFRLPVGSTELKLTLNAVTVLSTIHYSGS